MVVCPSSTLALNFVEISGIALGLFLGILFAVKLPNNKLVASIRTYLKN